MNKRRLIVFTLLIIAVTTVPLKAAEQCCAPCANGVLVGVTADSCGTCMDLAKFIPGCESADTNGCTACKTGFTLSNGACTSTQAATVNGLLCKGPGSGSGSGYDSAYYSIGVTVTVTVPIFIPNCITCTSNNTGCQTCATGTTRTLSAGVYICQ